MAESKYFVIIFCGPPGSLKTYLASRIAARLGFAYLPTSCFGVVSTQSGPEFERDRQRRYQRLELVAHAMYQQGLRLVIDGGFSAKPRQSLLARLRGAAIVARCSTIDEELARARLAVRAMDHLDCESASASEVLQSGPSDAGPDSWFPDSEVPWLDIVTDTGVLHWVREPEDEIGGRFVELVQAELVEFRRLATVRGAMVDVFERLAYHYETTTPWRLDAELLATLRHVPVKPVADVLDLGCGTGP